MREVCVRCSPDLSGARSRSFSFRNSIQRISWRVRAYSWWHAGRYLPVAMCIAVPGLLCGCGSVSAAAGSHADGAGAPQGNAPAGNATGIAAFGLPATLSCDTAFVTGAAADVCTVVLTAASNSAQTVSLSSDNPAVTVPATVTVPAGSNSASFTATVAAVSSAQTATLTATAYGASKPFTLRLSASVTTTRAIRLSASSIAFGNVSVNTAATHAVTVTSSGSAALTISAATVSGTGFSVSGLSLPLTLNPGQSTTFDVDFDPKAAGSAAGTVTVTSDASTGSTATITLSGTGTTSTAQTQPALTVSAGSVSFGSVPVNTAATAQNVALTSSGSAALTISSVAVSGAGFSVSAGTFPVTLSPGQSVTVAVHFDPSAAGLLSGALTVSSNSSSGGTTTIALSGTGTASTPTLTLSTTSLAFGNVTLNAPATQAVKLAAGGSTSVTISGVTVTGAGFSISGISFPVTLSPGQTATLDVKFDPTTAGPVTGRLTFSNTATGTSTMALSGTGQALAYQVDLKWDAPAGSSDPNSLAGYRIYRAASGSSYQLLNSSLETGTTYTDSNVVSGTTYDYEVTSVDSAGNESVPSSVFSIAIP